jgi:hypothetical protein
MNKLTYPYLFLSTPIFISENYQKYFRNVTSCLLNRGKGNSNKEKRSEKLFAEMPARIEDSGLLSKVKDR